MIMSLCTLLLTEVTTQNMTWLGFLCACTSNRYCSVTLIVHSILAGFLLENIRRGGKTEHRENLGGRLNSVRQCGI